MGNWPVQSVCEKHQWASYVPNDPCPHCARERVPAIVRDFDEHVAPDLKNAFKLAQDLFTGDFFQRHGFVDTKPVTMLPSGPVYQPQAPTPPTVIDVPVATNCLTCGGLRQVGAAGFRVPCPVCGKCPTCDGRGMVGLKGHEVACPVCCVASR